MHRKWSGCYIARTVTISQSLDCLNEVGLTRQEHMGRVMRLESNSLNLHTQNSQAHLDNTISLNFQLTWCMAYREYCTNWTRYIHTNTLSFSGYHRS